MYKRAIKITNFKIKNWILFEIIYANSYNIVKENNYYKDKKYYYLKWGKKTFELLENIVNFDKYNLFDYTKYCNYALNILKDTLKEYIN